MDVSLIYEKTVERLNDSRRIVHQGGQASGKTVNIMGALATIAARERKVITVTSMSFPHLKAGAMRDFERYVMPSFDSCIKQWRKTDHVALWKSGSILEFKTYESEFDARGAKRDILFVNEANTFDYMTWFQLDSRSTKSIIDYNPTTKFWAHEKVIGEKGTAFFRSWHVHNHWLMQDKHDEIEEICTFLYDEQGNVVMDGENPVVVKGDYELWKVYARGITGNVKGIIYPNWRQIESVDWEEPFFAIDFGYTNDPTAIVKIEKRKEDIYVEEIAYKRGEIPAIRIKEILEAYGYTDDTIIYCEHDPDMIKQLQLLDVRAIAARKGKNSINPGIEKIKEYNVFYVGRNIKAETEKYIWVVDELGNPTNKPIDAHNHLLDAIRYGVYSHFYREENQDE